MLQVTQKVDVVCSAISIKEAIGMVPVTACICDAIKHKNNASLCLTRKQCVTIGRILGELGFVNEMGENPLELIQDQNVEELEQDLAAQCSE